MLFLTSLHMNVNSSYERSIIFIKVSIPEWLNLLAHYSIYCLIQHFLNRGHANNKMTPSTSVWKCTGFRELCLYTRRSSDEPSALEPWWHSYSQSEALQHCCIQIEKGILWLQHCNLWKHAAFCQMSSARPKACGSAQKHPSSESAILWPKTAGSKRCHLILTSAKPLFKSTKYWEWIVNCLAHAGAKHYHCS